MASKATRHFSLQRATAIIQVPLVIWLVISIVRHAGDSHAAFMSWVSQPLTAALLGTFVVVVGLHMKLGMDEVIEDYIHKKPTRGALMSLNTLYAVVMAAGAVFSIIAITMIA